MSVSDNNGYLAVILTCLRNIQLTSSLPYRFAGTGFIKYHFILLIYLGYITVSADTLTRSINIKIDPDTLHTKPGIAAPEIDRDFYQL